MPKLKVVQDLFSIIMNICIITITTSCMVLPESSKCIACITSMQSLHQPCRAKIFLSSYYVPIHSSLSMPHQLSISFQHAVENLGVQEEKTPQVPSGVCVWPHDPFSLKKNFFSSSCLLKHPLPGWRLSVGQPPDPRAF